MIITAVLPAHVIFHGQDQYIEPSILEQPFRTDDGAPSNTIDHVRLPKIKLQTFNGGIDDWLSFFDDFTTLTHWKMDLQKVKKFHYLKGCLQGDEDQLLDGMAAAV